MMTDLPIVTSKPFHDQAAAVRAMGSPFVAAVLDAVGRQLARAPLTSALVADWPRDEAADALAMRVAGALHALARAGDDAALALLYRDRTGDMDRTIGDALARADAFVADWIRDPPQTNEVGRTAATMAALMVLRARFAMPCALLELGASAGLNLNLTRYAHDLGGVAAGDAASPVRIAPDWRGPPPPAHAVEIASARGVDLHPLAADEQDARDRLMAFVWPDDAARADRLSAALRIARDAPPRVDRGNVVDWLPAQLAEPQPAGTCRVVVHSMVLQYLAPAARAAVEDALAIAGARATAERPLARIGFEWTPARDAVRLRLTSWPDGRTVDLATCHAYGAWIDWHQQEAR
ncbi:DUF2332 domain-containing protein [Sphingomonas adhaesiva]|uniref:DUF2332 domain-containing protein n=1 Tax=Sphingomonas adhaesiva TaxID=28212 RepID=UPI002FF57CF3